MTDIDTIRTIIADPIQFDRAEGIGDGLNTEFPLPNTPVIAATEIITVNGVAQVAPADYGLNNPMGLISFVTPPNAGEVIITTYHHALLTDDNIQTFLDINGANVRRAAADALDTIASSEALIQKRITMLDLQTDGKAVAEALRAHAKALRDQETEFTEEEDGLFDYAEMQFSPFGRIPRQRRPGWPY